MVLKEDLDVDIASVMNTEEENDLAEAQERMSKSDIKQLWSQVYELRSNFNNNK